MHVSEIVILLKINLDSIVEMITIQEIDNYWAFVMHVRLNIETTTFCLRDYPVDKFDITKLVANFNSCWVFIKTFILSILCTHTSQFLPDCNLDDSFFDIHFSENLYKVMGTCRLRDNIILYSIDNHVDRKTCCN